MSVSFTNTQLLPEFGKFADQLSGLDFDGRSYITPLDVLRAHFFIADYFMSEGEEIATPGPRSVDLLMSAIDRQTTGYDSQMKWVDPLHQCATLFFGLVKNHAFYDGNKRTALLTLLYHLHKLKRVPEIRQREFEVLAVRTAGSELGQYKQYKRFSGEEDPEVLFIGDFLRRGTRREDRTAHQLTFREFDALLRKHGHALENPSGNRIDLIRYSNERYGFLSLKTRTITTRVMSMGFPRWTAPVYSRELREALRAAGLTVENGYDSKVLFEGAEPLHTLIDQYRGPLNRLKDR